MYKNKKILALITARGGSKGLPKKNIKKLLTKPLIAWTLESAKACPLIDRIYISTDCPEIASVCEEYNVPVPHLRPAHLATDTSPSIDVINHVIQSLEAENEYYDYILLLQPTSPLRKKDDLQKAIQQLLDSPQAKALISIGEVHSAHPVFMKKINENGLLEPYIENAPSLTRRQAAEKVYFSYGYIYLVETNHFIQNKSLYASGMLHYPLQRWQCYEIDDIYDFICVEAIMKEKLEEIEVDL